jgi:hypothetical protein
MVPLLAAFGNRLRDDMARICGGDPPKGLLGWESGSCQLFVKSAKPLEEIAAEGVRCFPPAATSQEET